MKQTGQNLPKELQSLVGKCIRLLGEVIKEEGGAKLYKDIESLRVSMASYRNLSEKRKYSALEDLYSTLEKMKGPERHNISTANSLMLELTNVCEAAYRTYQIRKTNLQTQMKKVDSSIIFVLTAHPTEVRTTQNMTLFQRIQNVCIRLLEKSGEEDYLQQIIKHNLKLAWLIPMTKHKKPNVIDEANHLFSIVLRPDILDTIIRTNRDYQPIKIRTWVGGDKDGHPGIDDKVMMECLSASRLKFVAFITSYLDLFSNELKGLDFNSFIQEAEKIKKALKNVSTVRNNDFESIIRFKRSVNHLQSSYVKLVGAENPRLKKIIHVLELFPALVISIELREDSGVIKNALDSKSPASISKMLKQLKLIAGKYSIRNYAQGFIISMCQSYEDFTNAVALQKKCVKKIEIPVIPLFETASALQDSEQIVEKMIHNKAYFKLVTRLFNNRLEVMLGYSDSSKGMGVLPSRINIAKTMRKLDALILENGLTPVFFHGSGGSVDRGGGKLQDQTAWWPQSSLDIYKATVQGEMVERYFTSPEVLISNINKITTNSNRSLAKSGPIKISKIIDQFSDEVKGHYSSKLKEPLFLQLVEKATPYSYLDVLKLGSRPSKRSAQGPLDFTSIRAIPWILCWTQTRLLFPTWWGIGSTWKEFQKDPKKVKQLKAAYKNSRLFGTFISTLGFTLAKVEFNVFKLYLSHSSLSKEDQEKIVREFSLELKNTMDFVKVVSGEKDLLWHTPWLQHSITLRSSMIHPLNALQILGHQEGDEALVRKCVAGISCGMLTTG